MSKLIIYVSGRPTVNGYKIREFLWSEDHKHHIFMGRVFDASEFNDAMVRAMKTNRDLNPQAKVVDAAGDAVAVPEAPILTPPPIVNPVTPVSTITAKEVTVDDAVEVLLRLAPEKLRKGVAKKATQAEPLAV